MKVVELKDCARKAGIKGYSRMKKQDLIDALVYAAEVKKNLLNEINHLRKNLKARKGKFKYF